MEDEEQPFEIISDFSKVTMYDKKREYLRVTIPRKTVKLHDIREGDMVEWINLPDEDGNYDDEDIIIRIRHKSGR